MSFKDNFEKKFCLLKKYLNIFQSPAHLTLVRRCDQVFKTNFSLSFKFFLRLTASMKG